MGSITINLPWEVDLNTMTYTVPKTTDNIGNYKWVDTRKFDITPKEDNLEGRIKELEESKKIVLNYFDKEIERLEKLIKEVL